MAASGSDDGHASGEAAAWFARLRAPDASAHHGAFEIWYSADPRHARAYDRMLDTWEVSGQAGSTPAGEVRRRLGERRHATERGRKWLAAALVAGLALLGVLQLQHRGRDAVPTRIILASALGEIRTLELGDGSHVTLDSQSRVAADFSAGERVITLEQGRARFQVAADRTRPFVVRARSSALVSQGGVFDVTLGANDVEVAAVRGRLEAHATAASDDRVLKAGVPLAEGLRLRISQAGQVSEPVRLAKRDVEWPEGRLSFEDVPLADVVAAANRYNKVLVRLGGSDLAALRFTGTFRARDPEALARLIAATFGLTVARDSNGNFVIDRRLPSASAPRP